MLNPDRLILFNEIVYCIQFKLLCDILCGQLFDSVRQSLHLRVELGKFDCISFKRMELAHHLVAFNFSSVQLLFEYSLPLNKVSLVELKGLLFEINIFI